MSLSGIRKMRQNTDFSKNNTTGVVSKTILHHLRGERAHPSSGESSETRKYGLGNGHSEMGFERQNKIPIQGFTLLEVIFSVFVLSIAILGTFSLFLKGNILMSLLRQQSLATHILKQEIELIRDEPYDDILSLGTSFTINNSGLNQLNSGSGTVTLDDPFGDADIRRITVTMTWNTPMGNPISKSAATYITREGINKQ